MFGLFTKPAPVELFNTLSGAKEDLQPVHAGEVRLYSCGPTVYGPQHIGNLRAAVFSDTLARAVSRAGYRVRRVVNITDVGHLVGDGDEGEDKMAVGAKRENVHPEAIADKYASQYLADIAALNIATTEIQFPRATAYIGKQIDMIRALEKKGFTYQTTDGVYFDTTKFPGYGALGNVKNMQIEAGARVSMGEKKNPHDFVLWRAAKAHDLQKWDSPWGPGNPGWSIECSAMAVALLGPVLDIHTGGEDHIQVHHNNEIAQSECATGKHPFAKIWMHNAFMTIDGEKISKSLGNIYTLDDVRAKGFHPLALRYLFLQAHYRSSLSFTWEALTAAQSALMRLYRYARTLTGSPKDSPLAGLLRASMYDDLGTPQALAIVWDSMNNETLSNDERLGILNEAERFLGLSLTNPPAEEAALAASELPEELQALAYERELARAAKDFTKADELRTKLEDAGYSVEDAKDGARYLPR